MSRVLLAAAALAALVPAPAFAWGPLGHQTVAEIAYANVSPRTRAAIRRILKDGALVDTQGCPIRTLEDASTWPDCVRAIKDPDGTQPWGKTAPWHYQDVEICQDFDLAPACKDGNCVSAQIERQAAVLKDPATDPKTRVEALAFLIHFVGDLHQPLHGGENHDKGGNDVKADYGIYTTKYLNLHSVWDGLIAERAVSTGPSLVHRYSAAEKAEVAAGTVEDWSRESWAIARDTVYHDVLGGDPCAAPEPQHITISDEVIAGWVPTARLQIERGGLRLARELDEALG